MTLPSVFSGLSPLTDLNQRILAAQADVAAGETSTGDDGFIFDGETGEVGGRNEDPNEDDDKPDEFKSFSSQSKFEFERIVSWLYSVVDIPEGSTTLVDAFLEEWAVKWREEQGYSSTENIDAVPTLDQLRSDDRFINGAFWLPATSAGILPNLFISEKSVELEDGTSEPQQVIGIVDPLEGVQFVETKVAAQIDPYRSPLRKVFRDVVRFGPKDVAADVITAADQNPAAHDREGVSYPEFLDKYTQKRAQSEAGLEGSALPFITEEQLFDLVVDQPTGRRGSGGTTRRDLVFDRNHLVSQVEDLWHAWMMEPGDAPMGQINSIVDNYIREAKAFWSGKGGQLDFDTYVRDKLKATPRYKTVFKHKLPGTSEEQFLNDYLGRISQFGMGDKFNQEQGFAAVTSGAAPLEQVKRVSRTREVQNSGGFSQRLAQTLKGLGVS